MSAPAIAGRESRNAAGANEQKKQKRHPPKLREQSRKVTVKAARGVAEPLKGTASIEPS